MHTAEEKAALAVYVCEPGYCTLHYLNSARAGRQVYTAEEKAALAMYNFEENKRKEQKILADMQSLVHRTLSEDEEAKRVAGQGLG